MCLQSCAVTLCSSVPCTGSSSLSFTVHYLSLHGWSTHLCFCVCVSLCMCVLNLSLSVLWRLHANRFGWSLLVAHVCTVSLSVCLCTCACVHLCARQMFPSWCHCSKGNFQMGFLILTTRCPRDFTNPSLSPLSLAGAGLCMWSSVTYSWKHWAGNHSSVTFGFSL